MTNRTLQLLFVCKAKVCLRTYLSVDTLSGITREEDLFVLRNQCNNDVQLTESNLNRR